MFFAEPGGRPPAPRPLRLVQSFVNTLDIENGVELLGTPDDLLRILVELELLPHGAAPLHDGDLRAALEARESIRSLALANNGVPLPADVRPALERIGRAAHLTLRLRGPELRLEPSGGGVDGALGALLAVVHAAMLDGTWSRLKGCPRDVCHWVFYDRSKNASSKWCAMSVCGNRTNTKRYRRRHAAAAARFDRPST